MTLAAATKVASPDLVVSAGQYCIFDLSENKPNSGIKFCCPWAGCGDVTHLPLKPPLTQGWGWNDATQTLSPSIQRMGSNCRHHFSLVNGAWIP